MRPPVARFAAYTWSIARRIPASAVTSASAMSPRVSGGTFSSSRQFRPTDCSYSRNSAAAGFTRGSSEAR